MLGMLLTSLNESLSTLLPDTSTSTSSRRLQQVEDVQVDEFLSGFDDFSIIQVLSFDDYVYEENEAEDDDELNPWSSFGTGGAVSFPGMGDEDLTSVFDQILSQYGGDLSGMLGGIMRAPSEQIVQVTRVSVSPTDEAEDKVLGTVVQEATIVELPQFAVFGPQRGSQEGETIVVTDPAQLPPFIPTQRAADILITPLQDSARTQVPHNLQSGGDQLDARWWGIVAGVALCCLLAALVFIMGWSKAQSGRRRGEDGGEGEYSSADSAQSNPLLLTGSSKSTDDWVQAVRTKESKIDLVPGQAARKVSNLPA